MCVGGRAGIRLVEAANEVATKDFGDVIVWMLQALKRALATKRGNPVNWNEIWLLIRPKKGLPTLLETKSKIDAVWGRHVWTHDRLYMLLSTLVDLEPPRAPLVARNCYRRKARGGEHHYTVEEYELTHDGSLILGAYLNNADISYKMPLPFYLLQVRGLRTALSPQDRPPPLSPRPSPSDCILPVLLLAAW